MGLIGWRSPSAWMQSARRLGKRSGIIAVCDGGFAGKLKELLASAEQTGILPGKQGNAHAERQEPHGGAPDTQETEEESHL